VSPHAAALLAVMVTEDFDVERDDSRYHRLVKRRSYMEGDAHHFSEAVYELMRKGLVDVAVNGSGTCWINDKGRAAHAQSKY
jgi:hypothetical protein